MVDHLTQKILACIFDIDGTLIDSIPEITISVNTVLTRYKRATYTENQYQNFVGYGIEYLVKKSFQCDEAHSNFDQICKEVQKEYLQNFGQYALVFKTISSVLKNLAGKGILLGIQSNKPDILAKKTAQLYFPDIPFSHIFGANQEYPKKPHPFGVKKMISDWELSPKNVILIGDSIVDIQTAQAARIISGFANWGYTTPEAMKNCNPDCIFNQPTDILSLFEDAESL